MKTALQRFKSKVNTSGSCHTWTGSVDDSGYGTFRFNGKTHKAHRVAWRIYFGPIPDGLCVCHSCDNPPCVNPDHLWLGTNTDNIHDKERKGRGNQPSGAKSTMHRYPGLVRGIRNPNAMLNDEKVREIRLKSVSRTHASVAAEYGVRPCTIQSICYRRSWKHVK